MQARSANGGMQDIPAPSHAPAVTGPCAWAATCEKKRVNEVGAHTDHCTEGQHAPGIDHVGPLPRIPTKRGQRHRGDDQRPHPRHGELALALPNRRALGREARPRESFGLPFRLRRSDRDLKCRAAGDGYATAKRDSASSMLVKTQGSSTTTRRMHDDCAW